MQPSLFYFFGAQRESISVTVGSLNRTAYATVVHSVPVGGPMVESLSAPMAEEGAYRIDLSRYLLTCRKFGCLVP